MLETNWISVKSPGVLGWNNFDEAESIDPQESPLVDNAIYDGGFTSPRPGSSLFAEKPTGETGSPLQLIETRTSDGLEYLVGIYDNHFYLYHPTIEDWVRINPTYIPTQTEDLYGYQVWNNGRSDDRLYACNGVDNFIRWDICVSTVAIVATAGDPTVTLVDATRFPAIGTVVFKSGGNEFSQAYTSKLGNVITLTVPLTQNLAIGDATVSQAVEVPAMEVGRIVVKHSSRLFVMNYFGGETTGWYSVLNDPEDYTTGSDIGDASTFVIADGNGAIIGGHDFGTYLVIEKEDSLHRFEIIVDSTLASKLDKITPLISGWSMGPLGQESTIKMQNRLLYPTKTEGFFSVSPETSGDSASSGVSIISKKIQTYVTQSAVYTACRSIAYRQKALWAIGRFGATENSYVLMFDTMRNAWSRFSGWAVKDWAGINGNLYYMENGTGDVYHCFDKSFNDANNPYTVSFSTPRYNFGAPVQPKIESLVYVQGYMTPASEFYIDALFNEGGTLDTQTFRINKDTEGLQFSEPLTDELGIATLGTVAAGYVALMEIGNISFFRGYLGIKVANGFYNLQLNCRSNKEAFWAVTGIGFNPDVVNAVPALMVMSPMA